MFKKRFTISVFLICLSTLFAQKPNFILLRQEGGRSDKSMFPILIINKILVEKDSLLIIKLVRGPAYFIGQNDHIYKYEKNAFNLVDTVLFAKISKQKIKQKRDRGVLKIYCGADGNILREVEIQWGEISVKHLKRVCGILGTTGDYGDLIKDFEDNICLMKFMKYPCD